MRHRTALFTALSVSLLGLTAAATAQERVLTLREMAAHMEQRLSAMGAEVGAIEFDGSGDKRPHYHVTMRFANGVTHMDVDAVTREISGHDATAVPAQGAISLLEATRIAAATIPGEIVAATLDATGGSSPHYHVDVRLPTQRIALVKVDAGTRELGWRLPIIAPR